MCTVWWRCSPRPGVNAPAARRIVPFPSWSSVRCARPAPRFGVDLLGLGRRGGRSGPLGPVLGVGTAAIGSPRRSPKSHRDAARPEGSAAMPERCVRVDVATASPIASPAEQVRQLSSDVRPMGPENRGLKHLKVMALAMNRARAELRHRRVTNASDARRDPPIPERMAVNNRSRSPAVTALGARASGRLRRRRFRPQR